MLQFDFSAICTRCGLTTHLPPLVLVQTWTILPKRILQWALSCKTCLQSRSGISLLQCHPPWPKLFRSLNLPPYWYVQKHSWPSLAYSIPAVTLSECKALYKVQSYVKSYLNSQIVWCTFCIEICILYPVTARAWGAKPAGHSCLFEKCSQGAPAHPCSPANHRGT